jgi:methionyl-tRNA formyltransferase
MRLGLFTSDEVGFEIAAFLAESGDPPDCLVLDTADRRSINHKTVAVSSVNPERVFYTSDSCNEQTIAALRQLDLDLGILAWWPYIVRTPLIDVPRRGFLNFHPSLLPLGRGKDPYFWSIVEGSPFGVTLHFIDRGIDSGDVAFQRQIPVGWEDSGQTLYEKARCQIIELFKENYQRIKAGNIPRLPQSPHQGSFHRRAELDQASRIELDKHYTAQDLLNRLRARTFPPHPGCQFQEGGRSYQVRVSIEEVT